MKSREQYIRPYLDEANRIYDEMIDELVRKYKTDVEEEEDLDEDQGRSNRRKKQFSDGLEYDDS